MTRIERNDASLVRSPMDLFGWKDDGDSLPFVQLGDVFVKDRENLVFAVINASCDLQIVPEGVSAARHKKGRTRRREDSVLLLPGGVRELGNASSALTTELFAINNNYYAIEWRPQQLIAIPQCYLRQILKKQGYYHDVRLRVDRAIELQQEAFALNARVGLEVQPQLSKVVAMRICVKTGGKFRELGEDISVAGGVFHTRNKNVLVVNHECLQEISKRLNAEVHNDIAEGKSQFERVYRLLFKCPFEAQRGGNIVLKILKPNNERTSCGKIRVGFSGRAATPEPGLDAQVYFHFFDQLKLGDNETHP